MKAIVEIRLWASDRRFRLPGSDCISLMYGFGVEGSGEGVLWGAVATTADGADLRPGGSYASVTLGFWTPKAQLPSLTPGQAFTVWYGGDVGDGTVLEVLED